MFDAKKFCNDYNIPYAKSGKHKRAGWVNIKCKFCNSKTGHHLGINVEDGYSTCYHCGYHDLVKVIVSFLNVNFYDAKKIKEKYTTQNKQKRSTNNHTDAYDNKVSKITFPSGTQQLTSKGKKYLINRGYDPDRLTHIWGLRSTPHYGFYKNRILAPVYVNDRIVSFQCRDITNKHPNKYLACFQEDEIIQHQNCIYGLNAITKRECIIVEGITDVWKLGVGAVATFGIKFTKQQARIISKNFDRVFILYDSETQAQTQADELAFLVGSAFTNHVEVINLSWLEDGTDPGDLSQSDADSLMNEIGVLK